MNPKKFLILWLLIFSALLIMPQKTAAFWWFNQKKIIAVDTPSISGLTDQDKANATLKYKAWEDSFEKKNVEAVIKNQNNFIFSVAEVNYLFETVSKTIKNPTLTDVGITVSNNNINAAASFHKFINGHFSFVAKIISVENKIRLQLSGVKLYNIPIPSKWLEGPVNKELDSYFAFLYKDDHYQGFTVVTEDNLLQLKPLFIK